MTVLQFCSSYASVTSQSSIWNSNQPPLRRGQRVEVTIDKIDSDRRHIDLRLVRVLDNASVATPDDVPALGTRVWAEVCSIKPIQSDGRGGYLLLKLPGRDRPALLLCKSMSDELRHEFDTGDLTLGEEIHVEVTSLDPARNKVLLKDVLAPADEDQAVSAAA